MEFQSRFWRALISKMLQAFFPDILIALITTWYIKEGMIWAVFVFLGLQALHLALWAIKSIFGWAYFYIFLRKKMSSDLCDFLHKNKFPTPEDYEESANSYLNNVVENEELDIRVRLKAAYELGTITAVKSAVMQTYLMTTMSFEDAIEEYKRDLIRKGLVDTY